MIVNVDYNDVFRYVVGNTLRDPIEVQIDFEERYEMFDESIYDYLQKKLIPQTIPFSNEFIKWCSENSVHPVGHSIPIGNIKDLQKN